MLKVMYNSEPKGVLKLHNSRDTQSINSKRIGLFTHVDDGAAIFNNRDDTIRGECNA